MTTFGSMKASRFMKKDDVAVKPLVLTIDGFEKMNVAPEGQKPENKHVLRFSDYEKPMVLNTTNIDLLAEIFETENADDTIGKQIEIYFDPSISFGGKKTGGLRVRAPAT